MASRIETAAAALSVIAGATALYFSARPQDEPVVQQASMAPIRTAAAPLPVGVAPTDLAGRRPLTAAQAAVASKHDYLPAGTRSLLPVEEPLSHGGYVWNAGGVPPGPLTVWVDLRRQLVSAFRNGHEIGTAVILYGTDGHETPMGTFPILSKHEDYHSRTYDAPMPHAMFLTDDGVALHGSNVALGRATHGCVGLPPEFARLLFGAAERGDRVSIVSSDPALERQLALLPQS